MPRAFGTTPHQEIAQAFERENRTHTYVEQLTTGEHSKKYELRVTLEELLTLLDDMATVGTWNPYANGPELRAPGRGRPLASRLLRGKILATLGLFEDG